MLALVLSFFLAFATPCATEDSSNCVWDAQARGNGIGTSFVDWNGHAVKF